jgi:preprotein translocase SecF subunit
MFHDVIILMGVASLLGLVFNWEVDSLFLTAVVTVVGFSVQDVIVVFDRIRENSARHRNEPYETMINRSLLETLHRSLATQLNSQFVMLAIILFGGVTIRQFISIMLIGMVTGTYSSLFFAVPLLVVWERNEWLHLFRASPRRVTA